MTRREFGAGISTFGTGILTSFTTAAQAQEAPKPGPVMDQNTIPRRGVGLRGLDVSRASAGLTLFTPMIGDGAVYWIDLNGKVVQTWRIPYPPGMYRYLTESGTLIYNGKIPNDTFLGKSPFKGGVVVEADWNGRILWEVRELLHHWCESGLLGHSGRRYKRQTPGVKGRQSMGDVIPGSAPAEAGPRAAGLEGTRADQGESG